MTCSKPRFAFLRKSAASPQRTKFRPQLETLEDRFQPSLTGLALDGIEAHPVAELAPMGLVGHSTVPDRINDMLSLSTATYITGTMGAATARGAALGKDGSTYETGTITVNGSEQAYAAKYDSNGKQVFLFPVQFVDNNTNLNTEGSAVAVDGVGNVYLGGLFVDTSAVPRSYGLKISADGTSVLWARNFRGPSRTTGIAVSDPNNDGNGHPVLTGTFTVTDPADGPVGDHILAARLPADGTGRADYAFFYTFNGTTATQGKGVALNTGSTQSTPGFLAYLAGNVTINGHQQTLAFQINNDNGTRPGGGIWARTLTNTSTTDSLTGVAVNPDDSSVFSGTLAAASGQVGLLVGYAADGSPGLSPTMVQNALTLNAIALDAAGNIYTTGAAANPSNGGVYLAKLDSSANPVSETQFGGTSATDAGYGIVVTTSGSLWVVGDTTLASLATDGTTLNGTQDGFLASVTG